MGKATTTTYQSSFRSTSTIDAKNPFPSSSATTIPGGFGGKIPTTMIRKIHSRRRQPSSATAAAGNSSGTFREYPINRNPLSLADRPRLPSPHWR